jgi:hypothetical protein
MINALELIKKQKEKEKNKYIIYDKIYENIEKKILMSSSCNYYYTIYEVPEFLVGYTLFCINECCSYLENKLSSKSATSNSNFSDPATKTDLTGVSKSPLNSPFFDKNQKYKNDFGTENEVHCYNHSTLNKS